MRKRLLLATVALLLQIDEHGRAQDSLIGGVYWAPNTARRVTISQRGHAVAELSFPIGVFLDASVSGTRPATVPGRWEFKGDVRLRAALSDVSGPGQAPGRTLAERMSEAPFVLTMKDADVIVENVGIVRNAP
jgi:hypothetical protein